MERALDVSKEKENFGQREEEEGDENTMLQLRILLRCRCSLLFILRTPVALVRLISSTEDIFLWFLSAFKP